jgi:hypothetical protein
MSTPTSEWLTAEEAGKYLKAKPRTLLLWARQGKVKGFALSGTKNAMSGSDIGVMIQSNK